MSRAAATTHLLEGSWKVRRVSGLLPPGVSKEIQGDHGRTLLFGRHFGSFRIDGSRFVYLFWPIVDVLEPPAPDQPVVGRGTIFGLTFCRFRLEP
ncbi:MAG TPA: hypothetical protein VLT58_19235 [Polyangia bacterium]|nr:hypothetical protein [Polyangia bacterium]